FLKKLARQLRKQQGIKEDENAAQGSNGPLFSDNNNAPTDLFSDNTKGDWYFYNPALKSKGFTDFKGKWGNRPNSDNWRRLAAIKQGNNQLAPGSTGDITKT